MARLEFRLPDIGEGVAEAEIVEWHAAVGDAVKEGQTIVAVMTDKATVEMESPADGVLLERCGEIGGTLAVGALLFALETAGDEVAQTPVEGVAPPPPPPSSPPAPREAERTLPASGHRVLASPAVRQRAKALGIDLATVPASGEVVRHEDLDRHLLGAGGRLPLPAPTPVKSDLQGKEIAVTGLRRQIARRMQEAKAHIPHFTFVDELDVTALEDLRAAMNRDRGDRPPLSVLPFLVAALCRALHDFPMLNTHYDDAREVLIRFDAVHVGIATQTEGGLMVPVLRDAAGLDPWQIAEGIAALASRARSGKIGGEELRGSTITVTALGRLGGIAATPIINRPEVAIIAPHRVIDRAVPVAGGGIESRKMMNLSISCDHRVIDGYVAASFVQSIRQILAAPAALAPA
ncbi:2-oxo acid dehydrogenase subunit E2 [Novosphingobium flavum]|uniref:Dihydrolipoamide acetyltransferase component of pyruvate dehydrogenase complex n=1 Tax=Novosphingobium flavum TaxID=1778672 RepID=A0A7X1FRA3_9SPHN|nr:dihydrolipoamide acetyltransferase family protein [Novosphingobium flavum]MBC2665524.1 2-oxo acid dehydrogenase subunit E2 [Novosphingobium flavum]